MTEMLQNANYGWICPRCGRIMAPWVPECDCVNPGATTWASWPPEADSVLNIPNQYTEIGGSDYRTDWGWTNVPQNVTNMNEEKEHE